MSLSFEASTPAGLTKLNEHLLTRSYVTGYQASRDDLAVYVAFGAAPAAATYPHLARWYTHISALLGNSFPGKAVGVAVGGASAAAAPSAAPAAKAAPKPCAGSDDSDSELDLFGDATPEEQAARDAHAKVVADAKARTAEKTLLSKSMIILDVKPWDDETDMAKLEAHVRSVEKDGLLWGSSKLVPVGFGIKKLQITAIILDAKVPSFDAIIEDDLVQDGENEYIQSADIASFNKL